MIDLGSIGGLYAHDHELHAYCTRCHRWAVLDLGGMVEAGQGDRRLPLTVRCRGCGEIGRLQMRPPAPRPTRANGWIQFP
jgi:RNase P subunit RPR2